MKKTFRIIIPLLLLLALIVSIKPVQSSVDVNVKPGIEVCGDDDAYPDIIRSE